MKVLIYVNKEKDKQNLILEELKKNLNKYHIEFTVADDDNFIVRDNFNAIFVIGGDGTILWRTQVANENNIPIIGVNAGKLGFLSEFESKEISKAVELFVAGQLVLDKRATLKIEYNNQVFYALNDVLIQRICNLSENCSTTSLNILVDGYQIDNLSGDGVIVSTPTGSTAYSLSAGGSILAPGINAFIITPICAHSFTNRPVVYSNDSVCQINYQSGSKPGIFVDGKLVGILDKDSIIKISKANNTTNFLRKKDYDFFKRLSHKLKNKKGE